MAVVLRRVPTVAGIASNPGSCVNIVLPELANPVVGREVALQALSSWKIMSTGNAWKIVGPGIGAQRYAEENESSCEALRHATNPR